MEVTFSEAALQKVSKAGGQVAVDFIAPVGCGKVSEVAVSTKLKGRNLDGYQKSTQDGVTVYMSRDLVKHIPEIELVLKKGLVGSKLVVQNPAIYASECKT